MRTPERVLEPDNGSAQLPCNKLDDGLDANPMGWEFAALWVDDPDVPWQWVWRRVVDDGGDLLEESQPFPHLDLCIADARAHGYDQDDSAPGG